MVARRAGVAGRVGRLIIINDIVDEDRVRLAQRLAVVGIDPEVAIPGEIIALDVRAKLLVDGIGDDGILHRDGRGVDGINAVPLPKFNRDVVENHVVGRAAGRADVDGAGAGGAAALPEAKKAADDVVLSVERNLVVHHADAAARCRLPGDGQAAAGDHGGIEIDIAAHVKNDGAVPLAHGVAKRTRPAVGQRGDVIHRAAATAGGELAVTLRAGKGQLLRLRAPSRQQCQQN